jgi:methionyl-tRNA formyltransferase
MIRIVILTAGSRGVAAYALPELAAAERVTIAAVIHSLGQPPSRRRSLRRMVLKVLRIGLPGALNGLRLRRWYREVPDRLAIRPLVEVAKELGIPYHVTPMTNCDTTRRLLTEADADLGVSLGNSYIAPSVFRIPRRGFINIHHEVLPKYQGAQSVLWQIHDGSTTSGYTIHEIDEHIDTGRILYGETLPISFGETLRETVVRTTARLYRASVGGLIRVLQNFDHYVSGAVAQEHGGGYTTPTFFQFLKMQRNHKRLRTKAEPQWT